MTRDGAAEPRAISSHSIAIAAFSTIVEWYDFTLYLYLVTTLARVFFGDDDTSLLAALGGFAAAYLMRPIGAVVFGHVGDRYGRRRMMLISMALMSAAMLATALLPTRATVGSGAAWSLLVLRCVMSFSVGGEYTGVVAYLLEGAPSSRRGLVTSLAAAASEIGGLLASGVCALTVISLSTAELDSWGWRIPFFVGAALAAFVWILRSVMQESPEFDRQQANATVPRLPIRYAFDHHRRAITIGFAISALGSITYYVGITYVPSFLMTTRAQSEGDALWISTYAACMVILVTPVVGALSDRFGRKLVLLLLCGGSAVLPIVTFGMMATGTYPLALSGALVLGALGGGVSAVGAVAAAEQLPGEGRLTGLALGTATATAIFGGLTPVLAQALIHSTGWPTVPGIMIAIVSLGILPVLLSMRETRPHRGREVAEENGSRTHQGPADGPTRI